jgi:hypothetical protein
MMDYGNRCLSSISKPEFTTKATKSTKFKILDFRILRELRGESSYPNTTPCPFSAVSSPASNRRGCS